ncbi:S-layer homology domain-containing protein [Herbivorax sp. ANBcel31]|uniref:S-layer homology domain-containing protein n=1 Tax=Herbivorax sp. ANBcel31 TaxID=3069754 RepID=UPI0027B398C2|nr:S-layer homology domain-containing protein [Herbivorax sp. ANBcel31]MDQ2087713.1 S-layer homology domain-containing protein [Herbivorax sp. ANBcel31]
MVIKNAFKFILIGIILLNMFLPAYANTEDPANFFIEAEKDEVEVGNEFTVNLHGKDIKDIYAFEISMFFDSEKLELTEAEKTNQGYSSLRMVEDGHAEFIFTRIGDVNPLHGDVNLCEINFKMLQSSKASIELESIRIVESEIVGAKAGDIDSFDTTYSFDDLKISVQGIPKSEEKESSSPGVGIPRDDEDTDDEDDEIKEDSEEIPGGIAFTDIDDHWSKEFALKLVDLGVLTGYPDNTLRPDQKITRAEGVVLLVNTLELDFSDGEISFDDAELIPEWCEDHVKVATDKKILTGYEDNTFRPFNNLTRAEMVVLVMNAFGYEKVEFDQSDFADGEMIPSWAADFIAGAVNEGIVTGYPDNTFRPSREVTRGEVFALIANCIE